MVPMSDDRRSSTDPNIRQPPHCLARSETDSKFEFRLDVGCLEVSTSAQIVTLSFASKWGICHPLMEIMEKIQLDWRTPKIMKKAKTEWATAAESTRFNNSRSYLRPPTAANNCNLSLLICVTHNWSVYCRFDYWSLWTIETKIIVSSVLCHCEDFELWFICNLQIG